MSDPAWQPDPFRRHQYRWWDGEQWTEQVADDGVQGDDPLGEVDAAAPPQQIPSYRTGAGSELNPEYWGGQAPHLSSKGKRIGGHLLDALFGIFLPAWIAWIVWSLVIYGRGQTPAKQILNMRVVSVTTRQSLNWGSMALRELAIKGGAFLIPLFVLAIFGGDAGIAVLIVGVVGWGIFWIASFIMLLVDDQHRSAWDRMLNTVVIEDPGNLYDPRNTP